MHFQLCLLPVIPLLSNHWGYLRCSQQGQGESSCMMMMQMTYYIYFTGRFYCRIYSLLNITFPSHNRIIISAICAYLLSSATLTYYTRLQPLSQVIQGFNRWLFLELRPIPLSLPTAERSASTLEDFLLVLEGLLLVVAGCETAQMCPQGLWAQSMGFLLDFCVNNKFNAIRLPLTTQTCLNLDSTSTMPSGFDIAKNPSLAVRFTTQPASPANHFSTRWNSWRIEKS